MIKLLRLKSRNDCLQYWNKLASSKLVALFKHLVKSSSHFFVCHDLMILWLINKGTIILLLRSFTS